MGHAHLTPLSVLFNNFHGARSTLIAEHHTTDTSCELITIHMVISPQGINLTLTCLFVRRLMGHPIESIVSFSNDEFNGSVFA